MSSAQTESVLIPEEAFGEELDASGYFPVKETETILAGLNAGDPDHNGVREAARLLLTEAAVAIRYVDVSQPAEWVPHLYPPSYKVMELLAFNDHGGGSESDFKILLNRHTNGEAVEQYVLLSPPHDDGWPSNLTFHRAAFTFSEYEPKGLEYDTYLPNDLKTAGVAHALGKAGYNYYLFGDQSTPQKLAEVFESIGFDFDPAPYSREKYDAIRFLGRSIGRTEWPGEQFAAEVVLI